MHITVYCPECGSRYHLKEETRGQRIRCPNPICRQIFEVREAGPPPTDNGPQPPDPPAAPLSGFQSGSVGDVVPILSAEAAEPDAAPTQLENVVSAPQTSAQLHDAVPLLPAEPVDEPRPATSAPPPAWQQAPPVRKPASRSKSLPPAPRPSEPSGRPNPPPAVRQEPPSKPTPARVDRPTTPRPPAETMQAPGTAPRELPAGIWEPPPIRRGTVESTPAPPPPPSESETATVPVAGRKARRKIAFMVLGLIAVLGVAASILFSTMGQSEQQQYDRAKKDFADGKYASAAKRLDQLLDSFPSSDRKAEYQFLAELSKASDLAHDPIRPNPEDALERLRGLVKQSGGTKNPLVKQHQKHIWETFRKIAGDLATSAQASAQPPVNVANARQARDLARQALAALRSVTPARDTDPQEPDRIDERLNATDRAIAQAEQAAELLNRFARAEPTPETIQKIENAAKQKNIGDHPSIRDFVAKLQERMLEGIRYEPAASTELPRRRPHEESEPSLLIVPRIGKAGPSLPGNGAVFALSRGVLYALSESTGRVLWATRVGIDTTTLPVRLPAREAAPEIALVLSSDSNTLTARETTTGKALWFHDLKAPCLGRPLIVDQRAYVPTLDGKVHEIEIIGGHLLGWYKLGLPLTVGGARQDGTSLLYFPADHGYVYVLDADFRRNNDREKRPCVAILQSKHPSGSLRGAPIIASWDDQMNNVAVAQRPRYLVLNQTDGLAFMKLRAFHLPITSPTAAPLQPEMRVRGWSWFPPHFDPEKIALVTDAGVLGLFGINQPNNLDRPLFPLLPEEFVIGAEREHPGLAQVVHSGERDFWVLAKGELHRLALAWYSDQGLQVSQIWPAPVPLGSPLHGGQINEARDTLFVVTQAVARRTCLATAVNAASGAIAWQRQLGLLCQGEPLLLGDKVLVLDQGGGLFLFDPAEHPNRPDVEWQTGGKSLSQPLPGTPRTPPLLLPAPDGKSVYEIAVLDNGSRLIVRRSQPGAEPLKKQYELPSPLAGTPALGDGCLVLPLADGSLRLVSLVGDGEYGGPNVRSLRADPDAPIHVVSLGNDDYLATDGSRGLIRLHWTTKQIWQAKKVPELPIRRIVTAPLVLPDGNVCVADAAGAVTLIARNNWKALRSWQLGGTLTAGPFVRGKHIGCVVGRRHLVWIDPAQDQPLWKYTTSGEAVVGQPQQIANLVVVADMGGRFVGLDPANGRPRSAGYTLKASVAPATAPVAFGAERAFAPLTDGTVLLLSLKRLQGP